MLTLVSTLLALTPPSGFTASIERVPVRVIGSTPLVEVDSLGAEVKLTGLAIIGKAPRLCPKQEATKGAVILKCATRKLWASFDRDGQKAFVEFRELTSIAWLDADARIPPHAWSLKGLSLPDACPGQVPAARAECALGKGDLEVARAAWEEALLGPDLGLANLRLGDLALLDGDVVLAMNHYAKVIPVGPVGRLAQARTCELAGNCFSEVESKRIASDEGLAPEFARELALYTLRRELVSGRDRAALEFMTKRLSMDPDLCEAARTFCQKVVEVGLGSADVEARIAGLSLYLNDRVRRGPREQALNRVASETAFELGAPAFAAAVLASNTPHVEASALPSHLLRIIKLYTAANDHVRAEVILEYADTKLGAVTRGAEWSAVRKQLRSNAKTKRAVELPSLAADEQALEALTSQVTLTTDLARAARARSQAVENQRETP